MKFKFLLIICLLISGLASAQISENENQNTNSDLKPLAGSKSFEVNFSPFSGSPISLNYLRGRYFVSETMAYRAGASLVVQSSEPNSSLELTLAPGLEWHFAGTNRLSPYYGAELVLAGKSSFSSSEVGNTTIETKGAWNNGDHRGFFNLGLNAVLGCDYYFSKHIFMGFEAGYGLSIRNNAQVERIINGESDVIHEANSSFRLGPNFNSALRLGFLF